MVVLDAVLVGHVDEHVVLLDHEGQGQDKLAAAFLAEPDELVLLGFCEVLVPADYGEQLLGASVVDEDVGIEGFAGFRENGTEVGIKSVVKLRKEVSEMNRKGM